MKIRVRDRAEFRADKMAKVALARTERSLLDLYCLAPGQEQKAHSHAGEDKIYVVLEGHGTVFLAGGEETVDPGEAVVAPAGTPHGIVNRGTTPLLALVVVTPPPPHAS